MSPTLMEIIDKSGETKSVAEVKPPVVGKPVEIAKPVVITNPQQPALAVAGVASTDKPKELLPALKLSTRQIICTRVEGGKWDIQFLGPVRARDINLLKIRLAQEYRRFKIKSKKLRNKGKVH